MDSRFAVIPAAVGMMLGPQINSAIFFATSTRSRANSFACVGGVALASTIGMAISYRSARLFGATTDNSQQGGDIPTCLFVGLLVFLSIKTFVQRKTAKPPAWQYDLPARLFVYSPSDGGRYWISCNGHICN